jgi:hypothetical protein
LKTKTDVSSLNLHIQFGYHDPGGPFGNNLMHRLIEVEVKEIEAYAAAQLMDMESNYNAL